ncbi:MAG TPA: sensor histidine kinase N-terminal domain-containing protein, partial [Burkholderiaceae bacterium]|nr:sensor histidine kinase N-terminal domain-containing protein [Burkholderiaceae bacterium]
MIGSPRSLQARLLVPALATVSAVWLIIALLTWFDVRHEVGELLDAHLAQAAALLVVQHGGLAAEDEAATPSPSLHRYARKVAFQVLHEGRMTQRSTNAPVEPWIPPVEPFKSGFRTIQVGDVAWRVFATLGPEPDIQVYVAEELDSRGDILRAVFRST